MSDDQEQPNEEASAWYYLFAPVTLLLFLVTTLWGSPIERAEWNVHAPGSFHTYLTIVSLQVVRILLIWAAWTWGGWIGVVVAITLGWRVFRTALTWFSKWTTG